MVVVLTFKNGKIDRTPRIQEMTPENDGVVDELRPGIEEVVMFLKAYNLVSMIQASINILEIIEKNVEELITSLFETQ